MKAECWLRDATCDPKYITSKQGVTGRQPSPARVQAQKRGCHIGTRDMADPAQQVPQAACDCCMPPMPCTGLSSCAAHTPATLAKPPMGAPPACCGSSVTMPFMGARHWGHRRGWRAATRQAQRRQ